MADAAARVKETYLGAVGCLFLASPDALRLSSLCGFLPFAFLGDVKAGERQVRGFSNLDVAVRTHNHGDAVAKPFCKAGIIRSVKAVRYGPAISLMDNLIPEGLGRLRQHDSFSRDGPQDHVSLHLLYGINTGDAEDCGALLARGGDHTWDHLQLNKRPHGVMDQHHLRIRRSLIQASGHSLLA